MELAQESRVVFREETKVVDTVLKVGDALHSHAEGVARVDFGVNAAGFEVVRIHHATAQDFHPSRVLAEGAALATADVARDVHLGAGLSEGEEAGAQAYLGVRSEHFPGKGQQYLLQVGEAHRDPPPDGRSSGHGLR